MTAARRRDVDRWLLILVSLGLLLAWSVVVPVFESPDEPHHWQYARFLHDERRLPVYSPQFAEANSPPLYYAVIAPLAEASNVPPPLSWLNASGGLVFPFPPRYFHNAGGDLHRYLPIRRARLLSVLLSLFGIWCAYRAGMEVGGGSVALLGASLMAFLPQFTFRGATVSNDVLVTSLSAAATWCAVLLLRRGFTWRVALLLAASLAGAYLSKISAICLVGPAGLAVFWSGGPLRTRIVRAGIVLSTALLLVAPWSLRNVRLYGDPFASGAMHTAVSYLIAEKPLTSPYFRTVFVSVLSRSFVGVFGWLNVYIPEAFYWAYWMVGLTGLAGTALAVGRRRADLRLIAVLATTVLLNLGVVIHINRTFDQPQGRYLFPALPALSLLVAVGLQGLVRSDRYRLAGTRALAAGLALANVYILAAVVMPAYYPPVTPDLLNEFRPLSQPQLIGLGQQSTGELRITRDDPEMLFSTTLDAAQFPFLQFEISGRSIDPDMVGGVFFAVENGPITDAERVPFDWRADGQRHLFTIPLRPHPLWRGRITAVRIDPVDAAADRHLGEAVRVERVGLFDNLRAREPLRIDLPSDGVVAGSFAVTGWAVDTDARNGTGVDAVHIWASRRSRASAVFLGAAEYGISRSDAAGAFGRQFERSGYRLPVDALPPGRYQLTIYAHSKLTGAFSQVRVATVEVR